MTEGPQTIPKDPQPMRRILLAENEILVAMSTEMILEEEGMQVVRTVTSVHEGLEAVRHGGIDLALVDVDLNDGHAWPVLEALTNANVPAVVVTGFMPRDLPERYLTYPLMSKPFLPADLVRLVRSLTDRPADPPLTSAA